MRGGTSGVSEAATLDLDPGDSFPSIPPKANFFACRRSTDRRTRTYKTTDMKSNARIKNPTIPPTIPPIKAPVEAPPVLLALGTVMPELSG